MFAALLFKRDPFVKRDYVPGGYQPQENLDLLTEIRGTQGLIDMIQKFNIPVAPEFDYIFAQENPVRDWNEYVHDWNE